MPRSRFVVRRRKVVLSAALSAALALAGSAAALAQAPSGCPANGICNDRTYALCIAASCDPQSGTCGVMQTDSGWAPCDQAGLAAGTCGPCYVFTGQSCSYYKPCSGLENGVLYSTYSEQLLDWYTFKWAACALNTQAFDCMDAVCTPTGQTVTMSGKTIPTATCACKKAGSVGSFQVNSCATYHCAAVWSTAGLPCLSDAECCSSQCTNGSCTTGGDAAPQRSALAPGQPLCRPGSEERRR
jgi:hypothetical protein